MGSREVGRREVGSREVGSREVGRREVGSREMGRREVGSREVGRREVGSREVGRGCGSYAGAPPTHGHGGALAGSQQPNGPNVLHPLMVVAVVQAVSSVEQTNVFRALLLMSRI